MKEQRFTPFAWRGYINAAVLPRLDHADSRQRAERLRDDLQLDPLWMRLAGNVRPFGWPLTANPFAALHNVVGELVFPVSVIEPPTKAQITEVATALRRLKAAYARHPHLGDHITMIVNAAPQAEGARLPSNAAGVQRIIDLLEQTDYRQQPHPLMPASQPAGTGRRNWLALYLRDRILPGFFAEPDDDAVAALIATAYPEWPPFGKGHVRQLRHW